MCITGLTGEKLRELNESNGLELKHLENFVTWYVNYSTATKYYSLS